MMDCPICYESTSELVAGPCGHGVCVKCTDPLFFVSGSGHLARSTTTTTTTPEYIPTLGKCPLCRQVLRYGDLIKKHIVVIDDDENESRRQQQHDNNNNNNNNVAAFPSDPIDERVQDAVYAGPMGVGWASIHLFEPTTEQEEVIGGQEHHPDETMPPLSSTCSYILKDDSRLVLTDPHFHRATQTISFRLLGHPRRHDDDDDGAATATVTTNATIITIAALEEDEEEEGLAVFSFSDNYSFIARGLLLLPCANTIRPSCVDGIWQRQRVVIGSNDNDDDDDNDDDGRLLLLLLFNRQCVVQDDAGVCLGSFRVETDVVDANNNNRGHSSQMRVILTLRPEAVTAHPELFFGRRPTTGGSSSNDNENVWIARVQMTTTTTSAAVQQQQNRRAPQQLPLGTCLRWQRLLSGDDDDDTVAHEEWILVDNTAAVFSPIIGHYNNNGGASSSSEQHNNNNTIPVPISGRDGQLYWRLDAPGPAMPIYHANALAGNVFCQNGRIGLASYHFVLEPETVVEPDGDFSTSTTTPPQALPQNNAGIMTGYISYEHSLAATKWPPLDNGRPIPSRMYFTNVVVETMDNGTTVLFRGTIDWMGTHGTTWNGATRWTYEIRFDRKFQCVVGGAVRSSELDDDDDVNAPAAQQRREQKIMSEFGTDLVYINAAVYSGNAATRHQFSDMDYIRSSGASTTTVEALQRALRRPAQPHSFLS